MYQDIYNHTFSILGCKLRMKYDTALSVNSVCLTWWLFPVSHYYGYGLLDAGKLVGLAPKWRAVKSQKKCQHKIIRDMPM